MSDANDWAQRLKGAVDGVTSDEYFVEVQPADIRAALERVEHLELEGKLREVDRMGETARANAAKAKLARVVEAGEALYFALRNASADDAPVEILRAWRDAKALCGTSADDIRAALERVEELERELTRLRVERDAALVHGPEDMVRAMELLDQAATDYRRSRDAAEAKADATIKLLATVTDDYDKAEAEVARSHDAILHLTREVARLEGLILDWHDKACERSNFFGVATDMMDEAQRIRAQREEGGE